MGIFISGSATTEENMNWKTIKQDLA